MGVWDGHGRVLGVVPVLACSDLQMKHEWGKLRVDGSVTGTADKDYLNVSHTH